MEPLNDEVCWHPVGIGMICRKPATVKQFIEDNKGTKLYPLCHEHHKLFKADGRYR